MLTLQTSFQWVTPHPGTFMFNPWPLAHLELDSNMRKFPFLLAQSQYRGETLNFVCMCVCVCCQGYWGLNYGARCICAVQWGRVRPLRWWEMLLFFLAAWPRDLEADKHPSWSPRGLWCQRMIWTPKWSQHKHARLDILSKEWNDVSFIRSTGSNQLFMCYFIAGSVFAKRCKVEHLDITPVWSVFQKQTSGILWLPLSLIPKSFSWDFRIVATTMCG